MKKLNKIQLMVIKKSMNNFKKMKNNNQKKNVKNNLNHVVPGKILWIFLDFNFLSIGL